METVTRWVTERWAEKRFSKMTMNDGWVLLWDQIPEAIISKHISNVLVILAVILLLFSHSWVLQQKPPWNKNHMGVFLITICEDQQLWGGKEWAGRRRDGHDGCVLVYTSDITHKQNRNKMRDYHFWSDVTRELMRLCDFVVQVTVTVRLCLYLETGETYLLNTACWQTNAFWIRA